MTVPPETRSFVAVYRPTAGTVLIAPAFGEIVELSLAEAEGLFAALDKALSAKARADAILREVP